MGEYILSIAMPSYNVERYLERGLGSFNNDRFENKIEVIVVNDGSTDSTHDIAQSFVDLRPSVFRIIDKPNGGHGSAINAGINASQGKYFRIVDGDDWVDPNALASLLNVLEKSDADIVVDRRVEIDMVSGKPSSHPFSENVPQNKNVKFESICNIDEISDLFTIHGTNVLTELLKKQNVCLLEKTFYVDYEYILKSTLCVDTIEFVDLPVYQYLLGNPDQSVADAGYVKRWDDHSRVTEELLSFYRMKAPFLSETRRYYLQYRVDMLVNTHYNIALIFDKDRTRGRNRAKEFRAFLHKNYPEFAKRSEKRYRQAKLLHYLGIDSQTKLDKITKRR